MSKDSHLSTGGIDEKSDRDPRPQHHRLADPRSHDRVSGESNPNGGAPPTDKRIGNAPKNY